MKHLPGIVLSIVLAVTAIPAHSQESNSQGTAGTQQGDKDNGKTCKQKLAKLCPGIKHNDRIQNCLMQQYMSMTDVCPKRAARQQQKDAQESNGRKPQAAPVAKAMPVA